MLLTEVRTSVCPDSIFPARISDEGVRHPIGAPGMTPAGLVQARQQQAGQIAQMVVVYHTTSYLRSVGIVCIP